MNIYTGLLFQQGFIQDSNLALALAHNPSASEGRHVASGSRTNPIRVAAAPCKPYKRGAIAAVCSIALSPFR